MMHQKHKEKFIFFLLISFKQEKIQQNPHVIHFVHVLTSKISALISSNFALTFL